MSGTASSHGQTLLAPNPGAASPSNRYFANLPPDQRARVQEDMADRERQASALAAAGHVAESVNYTKPVGQVLPAPPPLVGMNAPPTVHTSNEDGQIAIEGINWSELGGSNMDDIDMDFAAMFDPEQEQAFMQDAALQAPSSQPSPSHIGAPNTALSMAAAVKREGQGIPNPLNGGSS